ncbi:hypothetical protein [Amycolatopsis pigmentata]|uniref:Uncharacterized protein n=1 Tax=Amycolatopsis pigmentata TaxID=450801 RepID=A0ABW5G5Z6_9PSEU
MSADREMRRQPRVLAVLCALAVALTMMPATATAAGASACQREPRDAVAQLCADQNERMYGLFVTFIYPDVTYGGLAPTVGRADFYNETRFYTDDAMTKSFAIGLDMRYIGSETDFQPYWVDYTNGATYKPIGSYTMVSDKKNHTFMAIPTCSNCTTWDIYYDFAKVATTGAQPDPDSFHLITGWDLTDIPGEVGLTATSNRVRFLDGNNQFRQFKTTDTSTRVPQGNCAPGADPVYCWRWDTSTSANDNYLVSWNTTKPIVRPSGTPLAQRDAAATADTEVDALVARAQQLVNQRYAHR